jgi:uncharacterized membrane protein YeaQ/YmgE (transglycosylase-associated protein family)
MLVSERRTERLSVVRFVHLCLKGLVQYFSPLLSDVRVGTTEDRGLLMSILVWLVVGLVAGFLASKVVNKHGEGLIRDIILGLVGSLVGGFIFNLFGYHRDGRIIISILVATLGAILVLVVYHKVIRSRARV